MRSTCIEKGWKLWLRNYRENDFYGESFFPPPCLGGHLFSFLSHFIITRFLLLLNYFHISLSRRNEMARKLAKDFLLDLQSGTLDL